MNTSTMDGKEMSLEDVIRVTAELLENIQVPAGMASAVGVPIERAAGNLRYSLARIREEREAEGNGDGRDAEAE